VNRGDVFDVDWPGVGRHPAVIVTREVAIGVLSAVTVALVTRTVRGIRTEVPVGAEHGLDHDCVANCDNLFTVPKSSLARRRGRLGPAELSRLDEALKVALGLD
jgi:mRNA interferase MazF